jgi:hypothetical protein
MVYDPEESLKMQSLEQEIVNALESAKMHHPEFAGVADSFLEVMESVSGMRAIHNDTFDEEEKEKLRKEIFDLLTGLLLGIEQKFKSNF